MQVKNTVLQSVIIALQYIKNSAWAIEKVYRKTCVRKGLLRVNLQLRASGKHNFYPCFDEIQGSKKHSGTRVHPTRLHSGKDKKFQLHIGRKKKPVNSANILKTGHELWATR